MLVKKIKIRIKDASISAHLERMARAVNFVWNYCNQVSSDAIRRDRKFLSGFDLCELTAGTSKELNISSTTIQEVCKQYATQRKNAKKRKLRWRGNRNLGWIPFSKVGIRFTADCVKYGFSNFKVFQPDRLPIKGTYGAGEFCQDSRGRWYICISVKYEEPKTVVCSEIGIDLGLKDLATLSNGRKITNSKNYRRYERRLKRAQQANKKRLARTLHAKIKNKRNDQLHKASTQIVRENQLIVVGDLKIKKLTKTRMAKSTYDAGLSMFKTMLKYKASAHQRCYVEVDEAFTTRTCSACEAIPDSSPKGVEGLSIREWVCCDCGAIHDRDVNAALNILRLGRQSLVPEVA